jgi:hypothetical protein
MKELLIICIIKSCLLCIPVLAIGAAPVTTLESITNAVPGSQPIGLNVTVDQFTDVGNFTLTLRFDTTRLSYLSFVPHATMPGITVTYSSPNTGTRIGRLVIQWTGSGNQSLSDGATLLTLNMHYLTGSGRMSWAYSYGDVCRYRRYVSGSLVTLADSPRYLYFISGGIANRTAPVTYAPVIPIVADGPVILPVVVDQFTNIRALTLNLVYDPAVLTYQGTFSKNSAFGGSFLVGDQVADDGKRKIVVSWYTGSSVTLTNGSILCAFDFVYSSAVSPVTALDWFDNGPSCEYVDDLNDVLLDFPPHDYYINGYVGSYRGDVVLRKEYGCGGMSVRLKPSAAWQLTLDEFVFTVTWPAVAGSDVHVTGLDPVWPGLYQDGPRVLHNGQYYVTFRANTPWPVNWSANTEYTVATFRADGLGSGVANFSIIANDYMATPPGLNTGYYLQVAGSDATHQIQNAANSVALYCGVHLKVFLQGAYSTQQMQMHTTLANNNYVPLQHPYGGAPWNYDGQEAITTYPAGLVDWVLVELRTDSAYYTAIDRRAALLLSDGTVVDTNGTTPLVFAQFVPGDNYHIVVYHRSHLPVMSKDLITLPNQTSTIQDFTINPQTNTFSRTLPGVIEVEPGKHAMIAGDINYDNLLKYSGPSNDRGLIFTIINQLFPTPPAFLNSVISGYHKEDLNMDGVVRYSGQQNDQAIIYQNISSFIPNAGFNSVLRGQTPVSYE